MDRTVNTVTRTVTISDLTPAEMASIFAAWDSDMQAAFFAAVMIEADAWPVSGGWQIQAIGICEKLSGYGQRCVADLADAYISSITP